MPLYSFPASFVAYTLSRLSGCTKNRVGLHLVYSHTSCSQATAGLVSIRQECSFHTSSFKGTRTAPATEVSMPFISVPNS